MTNTITWREWSQAEVDYYIQGKDNTGDTALFDFEYNDMPEEVQIKVFGDLRITERAKVYSHTNENTLMYTHTHTCAQLGHRP
jgi:hypothetical protein